ncbi:MAG: hypothetical protein LBL50_03580, partial [Candidatus Margulisbacteria bacterium]|nr:hypothetical protein [Candidatus Margulisiibacteriota bacterium]
PASASDTEPVKNDSSAELTPDELNADAQSLGFDDAAHLESAITTATSDDREQKNIRANLAGIAENPELAKTFQNSMYALGTNQIIKLLLPLLTETKLDVKAFTEKLADKKLNDALILIAYDKTVAPERRQAANDGISSQYHQEWQNYFKTHNITPSQEMLTDLGRLSFSEFIGKYKLTVTEPEGINFLRAANEARVLAIANGDKEAEKFFTDYANDLIDYGKKNNWQSKEFLDLAASVTRDINRAANVAQDTDDALRKALGILDPTSSVSKNNDTPLAGGVSDPLSSSQLDLAAKLRGEVDSLENLDQKILELTEQGHKEFAEILRSVSEKIRGALQALENIIAGNNAGLADNNAQPADIPARFAPEAVLETLKKDIGFLENLVNSNNANDAKILIENQEHPAQTVRYSAAPPADAQKPKQQEFIASIRQTVEQNISFSENIAEASSNAALAAETVLPGSFYSGTALTLKKDLAIFLPYLRKEALRIATEKYAASVRAQVRQEISEQEAHTEAVRMLTPFARMVIQGIITLDDYQTNEAARRSNDPLEALRAEQKKTSLSNPDTYLSTALTDLGALYPDLPAVEQDILRDAFTAALQKLPAHDLLKAANQYNSLTSFQQEALLRVLKNRLTDIGTADLKRLATQIPQLANAVEKELAKRGELVPNA